MNKSSESQKNDAEALAVLDSFLGVIRDSVKTALDRTSARTPVERTLGVRHILDKISLALAVRLHEADPLHPELTHIMHPHRKFGGDNMDALYLTSPVDAGEVYRLYGNRGTVRSISFVVQDKTPNFAGGITASLLGKELVTDNNGDFEIIIGGDRRSENWLDLKPNADRLIVRQFFGDWENEKPMELMMDRLGRPVPPPSVSAEKMHEHIREAANLISNEVIFWEDLMDLFRKQPNRFLDFLDTVGGDINATPGGRPYSGFWSIPEDSALVIRVTPPPVAEFWNLEFNNPWWETHDYRYRLTGTNLYYAQLEDDGELIAVAAHDDPGVPNWLDTAGLTQGMTSFRWMGTDGSPEPSCILVKRNKLFDCLPETIKTISPDQRMMQIQGRRRGIYKRFGYL
jgi:hypothetical protein